MSKRRITIVIISLIVAISMVFNLVAPISATKLDDLKQELEETKRQLEVADSNVSSLSQRIETLDSEIAELDAELVDIMTAISLLEDHIEDMKLQIKKTKKELEMAQATEDAQYEAMKIRIKYMYERGEVSYISFLMQAESYTEAINKSEYIEQLYEYDRRMLLEYQDAKERVQEIHERLIEEEEQLEIDKKELEQEELQLSILMEEKKEQASDYEDQIIRFQQEAAVYKAKIKQQNSEIKRLEAIEKAKAEAAAQAAKKSKQSSTYREKVESAAETVSAAAGSASGKEIANYGCQFIGNPYVYGGTSLTKGADCSGFVYSVYKHCGYDIPRPGLAQRSIGKGVSYSEAQPGDIICYPGHVGIYIGGGQIVHASTPSGGIKIGSATYSTIITVRRVVD